MAAVGVENPALNASELSVFNFFFINSKSIAFATGLSRFWSCCFLRGDAITPYSCAGRLFVCSRGDISLLASSFYAIYGFG